MSNGPGTSDGGAIPTGDANRAATAPQPTALAPVRHRLRSWLTVHHFTPEEADGVLLAVGEAVSNAIEHAYRHHSGDVEISIHPDGNDSLLVKIQDEGHWREPTPTPDRGRGLLLIRTLTRDLQHLSTVRGTTIQFRIPWKRRSSP